MVMNRDEGGYSRVSYVVTRSNRYVCEIERIWSHGGRVHQLLSNSSGGTVCSPRHLAGSEDTVSDEDYRWWSKRQCEYNIISYKKIKKLFEQMIYVNVSSDLHTSLDAKAICN